MTLSPKSVVHGYASPYAAEEALAAMTTLKIFHLVVPPQ
jgi:hypothetical protein